MSIEFSIKLERKYTPTFLKGEVLVLSRDCYSYSKTAEFDGPYFKEGRFCKIKECGFANFFVNEKGEKQGLVMDGEWCLLDAILKASEIIEPGRAYDDEDCLLEGIIHVNDLREAVKEDFRR